LILNHGCNFLIGKCKPFLCQFLEPDQFVRLDVFAVAFGKAINKNSPLPFLKDDDAAITARPSLTGAGDPLLDSNKSPPLEAGTKLMGFPKGASIPFGRERGSNPVREFN
jgi:hypothetical protein